MTAKKERNALGTGLGVLFGDDDNFENVGQLDTLAINKIEPRKEQPRNYFDEEALATLSESIKKYGLIQPIAVRKLDSGYYQIIAGERRWRASRMAGLEEVPVRIIDADDKKTAELALVENLQRENLNAIEEAKGYKALLEEFELTHEDVANSVGKSRSTVTNTIRILNLEPEVIGMIEKNELSAGHAKALLGLSGNDQINCAKEIVKQSMSVRSAENFASKLAKKKPEQDKEKKASGEIVDYTKEVADELSKKLKRKVKLTDGKKVGKIEIEFYGPEDREALIDLLKKLY